MSNRVQIIRRGNVIDGYYIDKNGAIWSDKSGRELKPYKIRDEYLAVALRQNGKTLRATVHQLVAEAFLGPRPENFDVCHYDGNPTNNEVSNLRYASRSENLADRDRHGTNQRGQRNPSAKLTDEQAEQIRAARRSGISLAILSKSFGVTLSTISRIANGVRRQN